jgi:hypothetical protein
MLLKLLSDLESIERSSLQFPCFFAIRLLNNCEKPKLRGDEVRSSIKGQTFARRVTGRRETGQRATRPCGKLAVDHLALYLEPNEQEDTAIRASLIQCRTDRPNT